MMHECLEQSMNLTYNPTMEEVELWRSKFFVYVHETYRRVIETSCIMLLSCMDHVRLLIVTVWYMEAGIQPNSLGDWAEDKGKRSKLQDSQLFFLKAGVVIENRIK